MIAGRLAATKPTTLKPMKPLTPLLAGALLLGATSVSMSGADVTASGPRITPSVRPILQPVPAHSPYAGRYVFAAVDLRGENRTAGVGFLGVARDATFKGYIRNHETGKVARLAGKVMRNGRLEFIPDFGNVRHDIRILRRAACVHGLAGRYIIHRIVPPDGEPGDPEPLADVVPDPGENGDMGAVVTDVTKVIRHAGVVIGYRR
jgi:hypothetical protein